MESLDKVFDLLSRERRRYALYYLEDCDGPVPIQELAGAIQAWESESPPSSLPDDAYKDLIITLKHQHLPKAAQTEFIEYDSEEHTIELTGTPPEFSVILSIARVIEQPQNDDIFPQS